MCLSSASKFPKLLKIWYFIGNHTLLIALGWLDSNMSYSLYKSKPNYAEWSWLDDQDLHMIMQCCVIYYRRLLKWRLLSTMYFDLDCNPLLCIHGPNANLLIDNNFSNSLILGLRLLWTTPWAETSVGLHFTKGDLFSLWRILIPLREEWNKTRPRWRDKALLAQVYSTMTWWALH